MRRTGRAFLRIGSLDAACLEHGACHGNERCEYPDPMELLVHDAAILPDQVGPAKRNEEGTLACDGLFSLHVVH